MGKGGNFDTIIYLHVFNLGEPKVMESKYFGQGKWLVIIWTSEIRNICFSQSWINVMAVSD